MKELLILQITQGFDLLIERYGYKQANILRKFRTLEIIVNPASFSNLIRGQNVGIDTLKKIQAGIATITDSELGVLFDEVKNTYVLHKALYPNWTPISILEYKEKKQTGHFEYFEDGRLDLTSKVNFMNEAQQEIIEFGVRLNTFSNYFSTRRDSEFKDHITNLLKKGINIKIYMLDPYCNQALSYFNDRAEVQENEKKSIDVMKEVIRTFDKILLAYQALSLSGKLELWLYRHIPYNHFLMVDGSTRNGKMLVSHYLYGIKRANCPVLKISKVTNPDLYKKYRQSYKAMIGNARQYTPDQNT